MVATESLDLNAGIPERLLSLLREEKALIQGFIVGGFVRDSILGLSSKDIDVEVYGVPYRDLVEVMERWGRVDRVGKSFGVIKLTLPDCGTIDFSLPRVDSKVAPGHRGFEVACDESLSPELASKRRDFTINSLFYDPRKRCVIDYHGGLDDLNQRRLRVVDVVAFGEDPLRVLRGMQFISRFDLDADSELVQLARSMVDSFHELARERVCEEWLKWCSKSRAPGKGLQFLLECDWIQHFQELKEIVGVRQDPIWHPEGDVFRHTQHCCDAMVELEEWQAAPESDRVVYMLSTLLHDVGKAETTTESLRDGLVRIVSPGHERAGLELASRFMRRLGVPRAIQDRVVPLIANHMVHLQHPTDRAVRRLAHRLRPETIERLCVLMTADSFGRPPKPRIVPESVTRLLEHSRNLVVSEASPKPLLQGRDLLELRISPGPAMGEILAKAFEAQLDGVFCDKSAGLEWVTSHRN